MEWKNGLPGQMEWNQMDLARRASLDLALRFAVSVLDQNGCVGPAGKRATTSTRSSWPMSSGSKPPTPKRILDLLEPVIGKENIRAQVTADVDFSLTEATAEEFRPTRRQCAGDRPQRAAQRDRARRCRFRAHRGSRRPE